VRCTWRDRFSHQFTLARFFIRRPGNLAAQALGLSGCCEQVFWQREISGDWTGLEQIQLSIRKGPFDTKVISFSNVIVMPLNQSDQFSVSFPCTLI